MKLYKVTAKHFYHDEYDSFIIWANDEEEARALAIRETSDAKDVYGEDGYFSQYDRNIPIEQCTDSNFYQDSEVEEVIAPKKAQILLGSFNGWCD